MDYAAITDINEARDLAENLLSSPDKVVGFDIETGYDGKARKKGSVTLPPLGTAKLVGFSITNSRHWARYLPLRHDDGPNLPHGQTLDLFQPVLEGLKIVAHNAPFERRFMQRHGIRVNIFSDTQLEAYAKGRYKEQDLKTLVKYHFKHEMMSLVNLSASLLEKKVAKNALRFNPFPPTHPDSVAYACEDAAWCLALHEENYPKVKDHPTYVLEMAVLPVVEAMMDDGILIDFAFLQRHRQDLDEFLVAKEQEVKQRLGEMIDEDLSEMNLNSPQQLRAVLFEKGRLRTHRVTKTGEMSTDEASLTTLAKKNDAVAALLAYRKARKAKGSYFDKWVTDYRPEGSGDTARVHPSWKQNGVPAGRFAVGDPPVQQCPKDIYFEAFDGKHTFETNFRDCIVAAPGYYLLDFDYSQIELRIMAALSQEQGLFAPLNDGADIHSATAALMLGKAQEDVDKDERAIGKTMNFALLYGMGTKSLAARLGISRSRAKELYNAYFEAFPSVGNWMDEMKWQGQSKGYVKTYFGRRVPVFEFKEASVHPDPRKANAMRAHGYNLSVNAPVQGSAADYAKMAMKRAADTLVYERLWRHDVRLIINNHDELVFEVHMDHRPHEMIELLRPQVEFQIEGWPTIVTDWSWGTRWGSVQEQGE